MAASGDVCQRHYGGQSNENCMITELLSVSGRSCGHRSFIGKLSASDTFLIWFDVFLVLPVGIDVNNWIVKHVRHVGMDLGVPSGT